MNNEEIINKIRSLYPNTYTIDSSVSILESGIEKLTPIIKKCIIYFLQSNSHLELILLGYSIEKLKKEQGMNEIAAYLTLDWIMHDPDEAIKSLNKGHDFIKSSND